MCWIVGMLVCTCFFCVCANLKSKRWTCNAIFDIRQFVIYAWILINTSCRIVFFFVFKLIIKNHGYLNLFKNILQTVILFLIFLRHLLVILPVIVSLHKNACSKYHFQFSCSSIILSSTVRKRFHHYDACLDIRWFGKSWIVHFFKHKIQKLLVTFRHYQAKFQMYSSNYWKK